jgi:hypothetical protein
MCDYLQMMRMTRANMRASLRRVIPRRIRPAVPAMFQHAGDLGVGIDPSSPSRLPAREEVFELSSVQSLDGSSVSRKILRQPDIVIT